VLIITQQRVICEDISNISFSELEKYDLIMFDPPFKPKLQQYKQIRENNITELDQIKTPSNINYDSFFETLISNLFSHNILKSSGWLIIKFDDYTSREMYPLITKYYNYRYSIIWDKCRIGLGRTFRKRHEILDVYCCNGGSPYWSQERLRKNGNWHGSSQDVAFESILSIPNFNNGTIGVNIQNHINQTPTELWEKFLKYCVPVSGNILDCFAGTGSIGVACKKMNLNYLGIEIETKFAEIANTRIERTKVEQKSLQIKLLEG
jgi:site-specific DNA-methyltransferase (adenine-specific)